MSQTKNNVYTIINKCKKIKQPTEEIIRSCIRSLFWELVIFISYNSSPQRRRQFLKVSQNKSYGIIEASFHKILNESIDRLYRNGLLTRDEKEKLEYSMALIAIARTLADHYGDLKRLKNIDQNTQVDTIKINYPPMCASLQDDGKVKIILNNNAIDIDISDINFIKKYVINEVNATMKILEKIVNKI